jgi:hypothetical protein
MIIEKKYVVKVDHEYTAKYDRELSIGEIKWINKKEVLEITHLEKDLMKHVYQVGGEKGPLFEIIYNQTDSTSVIIKGESKDIEKINEIYRFLERAIGGRLIEV